jgi:Right handed beta helix region
MRKSRVFRASAFTIFLTLCLIPGIAHANDVAVNCPGQSLSDAVAALPPDGPNTVTVTGTCLNENVFITDMRSLTIKAGAGGAKIVQLQDNDTFDIFRSQRITLQNLEIAGVPGSMPGSGGAGVFIGQTSNVQINGCHIYDNDGGGVTVTQGSLLFLNNTTIHDNTPGGDGLDVLDNSTARVTGSTIKYNGSACTVLLNCQANGEGVFVSSSVVFFLQNNLIQHNGDNGIGAVRGSTVVLGSPTLLGNNTIEGHNWNAIFLRSGSHLDDVNGSAVIQGNGTACPADTALLVSLSQACGGISAAENSTVDLRGGKITVNTGVGISVRQGTTLSLIGATVSDNSGDGVHIQWISSGNFGPGNSITGNGGASIFCDARSLAIGNLNGFSNVKCGEN